MNLEWSWENTNPPTEKQLRYIANIQRFHEKVPTFRGTTKEEASEYIATYKNYPKREFIDERRPHGDPSQYPQAEDFYDEEMGYTYEFWRY